MKNLKLQLTVFVLAAAVLLGAYFLYRRAYPRYIPPPPRPEVTLTIIPGWNLRQVADYLALKGFASSTKDVYAVTGRPVADFFPVMDPSFTGPTGYAVLANKPDYVNYEGYLAPETFRFFPDAKLFDIITKFVAERDRQFATLATSTRAHSTHDILTMASIIEKEVKHDADRPIVADILWRRVKRGWALQVDSSVHYAIDKTGDVFTTDKERKIASPWNTYKYPGLPPGPICNPGLASIKAALNPEPNDYWYFLSGRDGKIYYGKTLEEHNANKKYL